jgi:NADPH:quinone reductase-like Zn-dependent oxidoreductase
MKAIRIHEYGDRNVLQYEECPVPQISDDEVLINVIATAINPIDWKVLEGYLKEMTPYTTQHIANNTNWRIKK